MNDLWNIWTFVTLGPAVVLLLVGSTQYRKKNRNASLLGTLADAGAMGLIGLYGVIVLVSLALKGAPTLYIPAAAIVALGVLYGVAVAQRLKDTKESIRRSRTLISIVVTGMFVVAVIWCLYTLGVNVMPAAPWIIVLVGAPIIGLLYAPLAVVSLRTSKLRGETQERGALSEEEADARFVRLVEAEDAYRTATMNRGWYLLVFGVIAAGYVVFSLIRGDWGLAPSDGPIGWAAPYLTLALAAFGAAALLLALYLPLVRAFLTDYRRAALTPEERRDAGARFCEKLDAELGENTASETGEN